MNCIVCVGRRRSAGVLCPQCAAELCGKNALCPEQVVSPDAPAAAASFVDQWGRKHAFERTTLVGRQPGERGIVIAEPSVSRRHADVRRRADDGWSLVDHESSNGTFVNRKRVVGAAPLASGDVVTFGFVSFYFTTHTGESVPPPSPLPTERPPRIDQSDADEDRDETFAGLRSVPIALAAPSGGGGGLLDIGGVRVQPAHVQFELVRLLVDRMLAEPDLDERVRGFIRSSELSACLPWDTARPDDNNLKQLVRRLRRTLERSGIADIIESRHGFGYRLRVVPRRES